MRREVFSAGVHDRCGKFFRSEDVGDFFGWCVYDGCEFWVACMTRDIYLGCEFFWCVGSSVYPCEFSGEDELFFRGCACSSEFFFRGGVHDARHSRVVCVILAIMLFVW